MIVIRGSFGLFNLAPVDTLVGHDAGSLDSAGHHHDNEEQGSEHEEKDESSADNAGGHPALKVGVDDGAKGNINLTGAGQAGVHGLHGNSTGGDSHDSSHNES